MTDFLRTISKSLGRTLVPTQVPSPPTIDESITRLVGSNVDLETLFLTQATAAKLHVERSSISTLVDSIGSLLISRNLKKLVVTRCDLFEQAQLLQGLNNRGLDAKYWTDLGLDATYDVDAGVTDVWCAVAETGSLVVRASASHGRATSLVPDVHIAIVEKSQIIPDLIDLMHRCKELGTLGGVTIITGPSKTADIEMNLVIGVHGPGEVFVFLV